MRTFSELYTRAREIFDEKDVLHKQFSQIMKKLVNEDREPTKEEDIELSFINDKLKSILDELVGMEAEINRIKSENPDLIIPDYKSK